MSFGVWGEGIWKCIGHPDLSASPKWKFFGILWQKHMLYHSEKENKANGYPLGVVCLLHKGYENEICICKIYMYNCCYPYETIVVTLL